MGANGYPIMSVITLEHVDGGNNDVLIISCADHLCTAWKNANSH
jgi:hypothetical protein